MEKRKHYRVKTTIFLLDHDKYLDEPGRARITNIGPKGAFVETDRELPVGTRVTLAFRLPGRLRRYKVPAIVRWIPGGEKKGFGVEFTKMGWLARRELSKWVLKKYMEGME
ncbi:MAG: hypothetical protein E3J72_21515 [Planctomycetota bacterium]|nr:MAG: hypothetical protein E3J72_21515 [Planctomycetota bacterium]